MRFTRSTIAAGLLGLIAIPVTALSASAATVPGTPTNVGASTVTGSSSITVTYTAAASDGGAPVDDYKTCAYINGSTNTNICADTSTPGSVTFSVVAPSDPSAGSLLVYGQPYTFKVKEHNSVGYGASSSPMASPVTATHVPERPPVVSATAGNNQATVTWTLGDANGSPLTGQNLTVADATLGTVAQTLHPSPSTTSQLVTGLTGGHQYTFGVQETNSLGNSTTTTSSPVTVTSTSKVPGQVLDLTNWKITLPTGSSGSPTEVTQPSLNTYTDSNFFTNTAGTGVTFKAAVDGTTTSGSSYPRSELREMSGSSLASWGVNDGKTHTLTVTGSVDVLPGLKPQTVIGQIHDSSNDVIEVMGDGVNAASGQTDITFRYNGSTQSAHLITNYTLGTSFTFKIVAGGGQYKIYANGVLKATITDASSTHSGLYFKAGDYTQANTSNGTGYGQTTITALSVTHV